MTSVEQQIFKTGSTTYYFSSMFFPKKLRPDIFRLYSFVRVADDYVDKQPAKPEAFKELFKLWQQKQNDTKFDTTVYNTDSMNERVIKNIVYITNKYNFDSVWIESFFQSMQADLSKKEYMTLQDTLHYTYGSAEVIGLMMARIMGLPEEATETAKLQGRAMQWINFIRDIDEDNKLDRCYFPAEDLKRFGLTDLDRKTAQAYPDEFKNFIQFQLQRYVGWQYSASGGFTYIPRRLLIPLKTAVDMYNWTADLIKKDPFIVFHKKVKPGKVKVLSKAASKFVSTR